MNSETININNVPIKNASNLDDLTNEINYIAPNTGITVCNVMFPITDIAYLRIADAGFTNIECGKIIDNIYLITKQYEESLIIVCDFEGVESISSNFCKSWAKLLLQTKNKIIPINMSTIVSATFSAFVEENFISVEE